MKHMTKTEGNWVWALLVLFILIHLMVTRTRGTRAPTPTCPPAAETG
jgi:hypothetical protein